jgi:hypothetical protein
MDLLGFAILLRHRHRFPLSLLALQQGYQEYGGILPDEWLRSAMITDFVNIVTMMETGAEHPKLFKELRAAVTMTLQHWNSIPTLFLD